MGVNGNVNVVSGNPSGKIYLFVCLFVLLAFDLLSTILLSPECDGRSVATPRGPRVVQIPFPAVPTRTVPPEAAAEVTRGVGVEEKVEDQAGGGGGVQVVQRRRVVDQVAAVGGGGGEGGGGQVGGEEGGGERAGGGAPGPGRVDGVGAGAAATPGGAGSRRRTYGGDPPEAPPDLEAHAVEPGDGGEEEELQSEAADQAEDGRGPGVPRQQKDDQQQVEGKQHADHGDGQEGEDAAAGGDLSGRSSCAAGPPAQDDQQRQQERDGAAAAEDEQGGLQPLGQEVVGVGDVAGGDLSRADQREEEGLVDRVDAVVGLVHRPPGAAVVVSEGEVPGFDLHLYPAIQAAQPEDLPAVFLAGRREAPEDPAAVGPGRRNGWRGCGHLTGASSSSSSSSSSFLSGSVVMPEGAAGPDAGTVSARESVVAHQRRHRRASPPGRPVDAESPVHPVLGQVEQQRRRVRFAVAAVAAAVHDKL